MCLSIPAKIITIHGDIADVEVGGTTVQASLQLIDSPKIGEYVLVHSGIAIQKISEEEANETLLLFDEFKKILPDDEIHF